MIKKFLNPRRLERLEHNLYGAVLCGVEGIPIELQARYSGEDDYADHCDWSILVTGMAKGAIGEAVHRISGAFSKYGLNAPNGNILINLSPAGIPKTGTSLDLPIAMICLQAAGYAPDLPPDVEKGYLFLGELSLHGEIRRVNGALPIAMCAKPGNTVVVPTGNSKECALIRGLPGHESTRIAIAEDLGQVLKFMRGKTQLTSAVAQQPKFTNIVDEAPDFASIKGQTRARRALLIAASGGHNVLMVGPPGEGKSLLASALPGILPPLQNLEKIDLTRLYSAKGLLVEDGQIVSRRPFRVVHHTASKQGLIGGGSGTPEPGEVTLAHRGVLFLDELAEFSRATLETLRQPIESGVVTISRVDASMSFPARFTLVAAMNPCPCGFFGQQICSECLATAYDSPTACAKCGHTSLRSRCECKATQVANYRKKISGPLLDRIDLHVELRPLTVGEKFSSTEAESTRTLRNRVQKAREAQSRRFAGTEIPYNAAMPGGRLQEWCRFNGDAFDRYKELIGKGVFSTRATDRMAKLARTIADLDDAEDIRADHIQEAAAFISGSPLA